MLTINDQNVVNYAWTYSLIVFPFIQVDVNIQGVAGYLLTVPTLADNNSSAIFVIIWCSFFLIDL